MKKGTIMIMATIVVTAMVALAVITYIDNYQPFEEKFEEKLIDCGNGYFVEYCEVLDNWDVHDGTYIYCSFSDKDSAIYYAKYVSKMSPKTEQLEPDIVVRINCSEVYKGVCLDDLPKEVKNKIKELVDDGWGVTPITPRDWNGVRINGGYIASYYKW